MGLGKAGADRQEMHEVLRQHAMSAWAVVQNGQPNNLKELVTTDKTLLGYLSAEALGELMDAGGHLGDAPERSLQVAAAVQQLISDHS